MPASFRPLLVAVFLLCAGCPPQGEPGLLLRLSLRTVTDATPVLVKVTGSKPDGSVGSGRVHIASEQGSLTTPVEVQLDTFGSGSVGWICDPRAEPACAQPVRVVAEWVSEGVTVKAEATLNAGGVTVDDGGSPGATVLSGTCAASSTPGATPSCCFDGGSGRAGQAPQCGWVNLAPGTTFSVPYTTDGGVQTSTTLRFSGPALAADESACASYSLTQVAGLTARTLYYCEDYVVQANGTWSLFSGGGCQLNIANSLQDDCAALFRSDGGIAAAHMMQAGFLDVGGQRYDQSDGKTYLFMIHR
jgi:hypothetical protein